MIRFLFRWAFRFFLILVVLVVGLVLLKDSLLKAYVERSIRSQTGMDVRVGSFDVGILAPTVSIRDLTLYNRTEFGGSPFLVIPDLHLEYKPRELLFGSLHLTLARIALAELNVVEGRDGRPNVGLASDREIVLVATPVAQPRLPWGVRFGGIDTLNLTLGKVRYSSLKRPGRDTEVRLGVQNEIVTNVRSVDELSTIVLNRLLRHGITIVNERPSGGSRGSVARRAGAGR